MNIDKKYIVVAGVAFTLGVLTVGSLVGLHSAFDSRDSGSRGGHDMHGGMMDHDKSKGKDGDGYKADKGGMGMMDHSMHMNMAVESEKDFIEGMIPHHEEAITTAKQVLERGGSTPEIKALAENIIKAQEAEVSQMKDWYKNWYGQDYADTGKYQAMMRPLESLSGAELDKVFLADMVVHHEMAIMMAHSVDAHIEHDEIKSLSEAIKTTQTSEIDRMKSLLSTLK